MYNLKAAIKKFIELADNNSTKTNPIAEAYLNGETINSSNVKKIGPKSCPYYDKDSRICLVPSIGTGGVSFVPAFNFLGDGQKTTKGIYPVLLYYNKLKNTDKCLILSYGYSQTEQSETSWILPPGTVRIGDYFSSIKKKYQDTYLNYQDSYIYKVYKPKFTEEIFDKIVKDVEQLIEYYISLLYHSTTTKSNTNIIHKEVSVKKQQKHFSIYNIISNIQSTGLIYSPTLIMRLAYSLMAKPFVILSGLAGSGKTQLALAFAKCLSENIEEQVCTVSIGADWTNREPLLGYPNALKGDEYVMPESGVLQFLIRANEDLSKPYFLILDEMNLSVVERYFADFLSAMESGEPIKLWDNKDGEVPAQITLPKNVFIIGTINVDETTYMFSPKVLDRANVIEFKIAADEMDDYLGKKVNIDIKKAHSACADMAVDFVNKANSQVEKDDKNKDILLAFFRELKKVNAEFGYRTVNEIGRYLHFADGDLEDNAAIDTAILQKLLPKLHGSRKKLVPVLTALWNICLNEKESIKIDEEVEKINFQDGFKYPESAEKIKRMYDAVIDNGFTSFAEA